jgi:hypothetical protein
LGPDLEIAYQQMAQVKRQEAEALERREASVADAADEC